MTSQAIPGFWTLLSCLFIFLEEHRALQDQKRFTCGDTSCKPQEQYRLKL